MSYGQWAPYVPVAVRKAQAARVLAGLRKAGQSTAPVVIEGRAIAKTFWGRMWCDTLESYRDIESRLPRGRTYVRNGSVIDLQVAPQLITAMVMGSALYRISIKVTKLPAQRWTDLCRDCAGGIDSVVELLQGRLSGGVMERLCRPDAGLVPGPSEIKLSCTCPDGASMCKHVAAALYGVGARLDTQPELLFRLRSVDETEMVRHLDGGLALSRPGTASGAVLDGDDLSALFGIDIADSPPPPDPATTPATARGPSPKRTKASLASPSVARPATPPADAAPIPARRPAPQRSPTVAKRPDVEPPVRYLTVAEAVKRSGKPPALPKTGQGAPPQPRPVALATPNGRATAPTRGKPKAR